MAGLTKSTCVRAVRPILCWSHTKLFLRRCCLHSVWNVVDVFTGNLTYYITLQKTWHLQFFIFLSLVDKLLYNFVKNSCVSLLLYYSKDLTLFFNLVQDKEAYCGSVRESLKTMLSWGWNIDRNREGDTTTLHNKSRRISQASQVAWW